MKSQDVGMAMHGYIFCRFCRMELIRLILIFCRKISGHLWTVTTRLSRASWFLTDGQELADLSFWRPSMFPHRQRIDKRPDFFPNSFRRIEDLAADTNTVQCRIVQNPLNFHLDIDGGL
jgi:hypothetical protein